MGVLKATNKEIVEAFKQSDSTADMAVKLNITLKTIRRRLHDLNLRYPHRKKFSDKQVIELYAQYKNIWIVGRKLGVCGQSVHERLVKLGIECDGRGKKLAQHEINIVKKYYNETGESTFDRDELLKLLPGHRTITTIEHIVTKYNLGDKERKPNNKTRSHSSKLRKGKKTSPSFTFKNHKHKKESKRSISSSLRKQWEDPNSIFNDIGYREKARITARINGAKAMYKNPYSRCKQGYYEIPGRGKMFFRSKWEPNYALYLCFLENNNEIKTWEYEAFKFEFPVKSGVVFYTPDFKVTMKNGSIEWHEVKGWMDPKSKTKIKRMAKYYPNEKLIIIGAKEYKSLSKMSKLLKWY